MLSRVSVTQRMTSGRSPRPWNSPLRPSAKLAAPQEDRRDCGSRRAAWFSMLGTAKRSAWRTQIIATGVDGVSRTSSAASRRMFWLELQGLAREFYPPRLPASRWLRLPGVRYRETTPSSSPESSLFASWRRRFPALIFMIEASGPDAHERPATEEPIARLFSRATTLGFGWARCSISSSAISPSTCTGSSAFSARCRASWAGDEPAM